MPANKIIIEHGFFLATIIKIDLHELITSNKEDYINLAIKLYKNNKKIKSFKIKLTNQKNCLIYSIIKFIPKIWKKPILKHKIDLFIKKK